MRKLLSILVALSLCASFASLSLAEEETREVIFCTPWAASTAR